MLALPYAAGSLSFGKAFIVVHQAAAGNPLLGIGGKGQADYKPRAEQRQAGL